MSKEHLQSCAIIRDGKLHQGQKSHYYLRYNLDPTDPDPRTGKPGDIEGFYTSEGRFVTRKDAVAIAVEAGQLHERWLKAERPVLSSDINWDSRGGK